MKLKLVLSLAFLLSAAALLGQGPAFPYSVALNWTVSVTAGVTGQNLYRAPWALPSGPCGTFVKINTAPLAASATSSIDSTVVPGGAYCYAVTATAPAGESGLSNIVQNLQIPPAPPTALAGVVN
jgi:hypothetical protein